MSDYPFLLIEARERLEGVGPERTIEQVILELNQEGLIASPAEESALRIDLRKLGYVSDH